LFVTDKLYASIVACTEERIQQLSDDKKAVEKEVIICFNLPKTLMQWQYFANKWLFNSI